MWPAWEKWAVSQAPGPPCPHSFTHATVAHTGRALLFLGRPRSCGRGQSCPSVLGLQAPEQGALGKPPDSGQTQTLPGKLN